jgi:type IV pilus assembly protein PilQ
MIKKIVIRSSRRHRLWLTASVLFLLFNFTAVLGQTSQSEPCNIKAVSYSSLLDKVRITITCDVTPSVSVFTLSNPERIVVDLINTNLSTNVGGVAVNLAPVESVQVNQWQDSPPVSRITINLDSRAVYEVNREIGMVVIDVATHELRPLEISSAKEEKTISMYVKDADIVDLLRMIATQFGLNIIITPDVTAQITVRLSNVPLMGAIDALVRAADCNYITYQSGIILIKPKGREIPGELDSRVFELDYVEATDVKDAIKRVLSTRGVSDIVYRRVGTGGGSSRASALIVTDYPEVLDKVATVIAQLDRPAPQVSIEAKFIETTMSEQDMYGIEWSLHTSVTPIIPTIGEMAIPIRLDELVLGKISLNQLAAELELLQNSGKSRLLANPRTLTLDNQTAEINSSITVPLRTIQVDPTTQERTFSWVTKSIPIGLKATPHITSDGLINMEVEPTVEAITGWQGPPDDLRPVTVRREAKTQVVVKDGDVIVLGGLMKDEETRNVSKIPILGDIPILGKLLFSQTSITRSKSELIIFIIPHIINP